MWVKRFLTNIGNGFWYNKIVDKWKKIVFFERDSIRHPCREFKMSPHPNSRFADTFSYFQNMFLAYFFSQESRLRWIIFYQTTTYNTSNVLWKVYESLELEPGSVMPPTYSKTCRYTPSYHPPSAYQKSPLC